MCSASFAMLASLALSALLVLSANPCLPCLLLSRARATEKQPALLAVVASLYLIANPCLNYLACLHFRLRARDGSDFLCEAICRSTKPWVLIHQPLGVDPPNTGC